MLAFLVLIGSAGVTVNRHFCKGKLKSVALFSEAEKCHSEQKKTHCPFHANPDEAAPTKKKGCCDDETELLRIEDQEPTVTDQLPVTKVLLPALPPLLFSNLAPHPRPRKNTNFELYRPPPLIPDARREFQVFRI